MKRLIKIVLLIILFAVKMWLDHPLPLISNNEIGKEFQNRQTVQIIGDTGNFHLEFKWNSENISVRSVIPSKTRFKSLSV